VCVQCLWYIPIYLVFLTRSEQDLWQVRLYFLQNNLSVVSFRMKLVLWSDENKSKKTLNFSQVLPLQEKHFICHLKTCWLVSTTSHFTSVKILCLKRKKFWGSSSSSYGPQSQSQSNGLNLNLLGSSAKNGSKSTESVLSGISNASVDGKGWEIKFFSS